MDEMDVFKINDDDDDDDDDDEFSHSKLLFQCAIFILQTVRFKS